MLDFTGMEFSIKLEDISKFEHLMYMDWIKFMKIVETAITLLSPYTSLDPEKKDDNLLLISKDYGNNHYYLIRNVSRLVSSQLALREHAKYLCEDCLVHFSNEQKLKAHQEYDCRYVLAKIPTTDLKKNQ